MGNTLKIVGVIGLLLLVSSNSSTKEQKPEIIETTKLVKMTDEAVPSAPVVEVSYGTLYSPSLDELTEEVRNEVFYGELEEAALIVQAEAGNQDELGKRYVADVILNRVDDSSFPDTVYDVIYQMDPIQFATTVDGTMGKAGYNITEETFQIVLEEYENRTNSEIVYFRTEKYHECGTPAFKHGDHYFSTK